MRSISIFVMCMMCTLLVYSGGSFAQELPVVKIGVVVDGEFHRYDGIKGTFRHELMEILSKDYDVRMPDEKILVCDWTLEGAGKAISQLLDDRDVDLVVCIGPVSTKAASNRASFPKPLVALPLFGSGVLELPLKDSGSGIRNFHYLVVPKRSDLDILQDFVQFSHLAVIIDGVHLDALPNAIDHIKEVTSTFDENPQVIRIDDDVTSALEALESHVDAVWVLPLLRMSHEDFDKLVEGLIERRLPSFSTLGVNEVRAGLLAGLKPADLIQRISRRISLNIHRILRGENAGTIPVVFSVDETLTINMATARAIAAFPRWKILLEADLIADEEPPVERSLTMQSAVNEAVARNLDLLARDHAVNAGAEEVGLATSILWPQIDIATDYSIIDADRAEASAGILPERVWSASATLRQIIFDEQAWANRSIQKSVQESRLFDRETLKLDIGFAAAVTYLNVMRAKTVEQIQRYNLKLTRENLKFAEIRESIGTASPGEVYRWQAELAGAQQALIGAGVARNQAEIELNRLLHLPLDEKFATVESNLTDPVLMRTHASLVPYINNPWSFQVFRGFISKEAFAASPELKALTAAEEAQRRLLVSSKRTLWMPTLELQASIEEIIDRGGVSSDESLRPSELDDTNWFVGLQLSYPLFEGGARLAEKDQASEELARVTTEKAGIAERIEQRVHDALFDLGASLAGIELSREAARATRANYELVSDAYRRGAVSILTLLDAQNTAQAADEEAANAEFNFMIDMMAVQRAAGRMEMFETQEEKDAFFDRLEAHFENARQ